MGEGGYKMERNFFIIYLKKVLMRENLMIIFMIQSGMN